MNNNNYITLKKTAIDWQLNLNHKINSQHLTQYKKRSIYTDFLSSSLSNRLH